MSPTSPYTVKRKPDLCHLRWKDGSSASLATHSPRQGGSHQQIRLVCTICRETKCWRAETFVFAIHLKSHYGRLQNTEGERNTTPYRRPGLLETSGCRLPGQFGLNCRRDETRRDETDRQGRHLRLTWPTTTEVSRSLGGLSEIDLPIIVKEALALLFVLKNLVCLDSNTIFVIIIPKFSGNLSFFNNNRNSSLLKCEKQNLRKSH